MNLTLTGLADRAAWAQAGITLPTYDIAAMRAQTAQNPVWVHFGAGNIFRSFVAVLAQRLLENGLAQTGVVAAETFDFDIITRIYEPHDLLSLVVGLKADGGMQTAVLGSVAAALDTSDPAHLARLQTLFAAPSLQMASYTVTEKGYAIHGTDGALLPVVAGDIAAGPDKARHAMSLTAALLFARYRAGACPIAMVSMDNCAHNGERLKAAVLAVADGWVQAGHAPEGFAAYLRDPQTVSFPLSMIDKITPRPAAQVQARLESLGVADMHPIVTSRGTYIAPFVNAEVPEYLVVEDAFPAGRPPLEAAGVYIVNRDTVNRVERMKVTTCLNPLHTALAVYGCLLGYTSIAAEMSDPDLAELARRIGQDEGMPVVTDPGIIRPEAFLQEVLAERLPNPFIPDTPQRIATDTSQKVAIRFGETIKAYLASPTLDAASLTGIPLALAGWLRYLLGMDDSLAPFDRSGDPLLAELTEKLAAVTVGNPQSVRGQLAPILHNQALFGVDMYEAGLAAKVEAMLAEMLAGEGAVRNTLQKYLQR